MNIFIFGNGSISFEHFLRYYQTPLKGYLDNKKINFTVCDFRGTDTLAMELLKTLNKNVTIFHIGEQPRYFPNKYKTKVAEWKLSGGFQDDESRDLAAIENCTHFIAKDFNSKGERISGTMKNILKCRALNKVEISIT